MHRPFLALLSAAACLGLLRPAVAADLVLDNLSFQSDSETLTIPHIQFSNTNVSEAEARSLFDPNASAADQKAVLGKLKAARILAPVVDFAFKDGSIDLAGVEADNVAGGKASRVQVASGRLVSKTDKRGEVDVDFRPIAIEDLDFSRMVAASALKMRDLQAGHVVSSGFVARLRPQTGDADLQRVGDWTVDLGRLETRNAYQGDIALKTTTTVQHLAIEPTAGSDLAQAMKQFGYASLDFGATIAASYDPKTQIYSIDDLSLSGEKMGRISVTGKLTHVGAAIDGDPSNLAKAISDSDLMSMTLDVDDDGLLDKVVGFYAARQDASPDSVRRQWAAAAALTIPIMMRGDPASLSLAQAISAFFLSPGTLKASLKAKQAGVPLAGVVDAFMRGGLSSKLQLDAQAAPK